MALSDQTILELKELIHDQGGRDLSTKEVSEIASMLVAWFDLLAKIYHEEKNENNRGN